MAEFVASDGARLAYSDEGEGLPLLCLPQNLLGSSSRLLLEQRELLPFRALLPPARPSTHTASGCCCDGGVGSSSSCRGIGRWCCRVSVVHNSVIPGRDPGRRLNRLLLLPQLCALLCDSGGARVGQLHR